VRLSVAVAIVEDLGISGQKAGAVGHRGGGGEGVSVCHCVLCFDRSCFEHGGLCWQVRVEPVS
jgi:hypothetical protein